MSSDLKLSYSEHAAARMFDRSIFKKQVRRTLRRSHRKYLRAPYEIAECTTTSRVVIRVIYLSLPGDAAPVVVSAVRLGKLNDAFQRSKPGTYINQKLDIAYVALYQGKMAETIEGGDGIYCDLDIDGEVMGVEVVDYSHYESDRESLNQILNSAALSFT